MRNTMITVMSDDFVKFARAKGLPTASLPPATWRVTQSCLCSPTSLCRWASSSPAPSPSRSSSTTPGSLTSFWPPSRHEDYPLMQAIFLIIVMGVLAGELHIGHRLCVLDPRIRMGGRS